MKFLRLTQVIAMTGISRSSIYKGIEDGRFPKQILFGERSVAWIESEVHEWMEIRVALRG